MLNSYINVRVVKDMMKYYSNLTMMIDDINKYIVNEYQQEI